MSTTEITYRTGHYYGEAEMLHIFEVTDEQGVASELYVTMDHLEVVSVETRKDRQGEGLARSLWEAANAKLGEVYHSLPAHRTEEGDAFARAVGGWDVEECHIAACCCTESDEEN